MSCIVKYWKIPAVYLDCLLYAPFNPLSQYDFFLFQVQKINTIHFSQRLLFNEVIYFPILTWIEIITVALTYDPGIEDLRNE